LPKSASFWKAHGSLIVFVISLILAVVFLYVFRSELLPFGVGLVLASILEPFIRFVDRKLPRSGKISQPLRVVIIFLSMLIFLLVIAGLFVFFIINVATAFGTLISNAPQFFGEASKIISQWITDIKSKLPFDVDIGQVTGSVGETAGNFLKGFFSSAFTFVPTTFGLIIGFLTLPLFIFFILKDSISIKKDFYEGMPRVFYRHASNIMSIIGGILGKYIRALLYSSIIVSILLTIALTIAGLDFNLALSLGVFAGFCEWLPPIGMWVSLVFGLIIVLGVAPHQIIWVILAYVVVIVIDSAALSGVFHGRYLKIKPGIMMVLMVIGSTIAGLWGMVLINPFAQTILEIYKYVRDEIQGPETKIETTD
jgi:predicted PurR-regulated permease PerM